MSDPRYHDEQPEDFPVGTEVLITGPESGWLADRVGGVPRGVVTGVEGGMIFRDCVPVQCINGAGPLDEVQWPMVDLIRIGDLPDMDDAGAVEAWLTS